MELIYHFDGDEFRYYVNYEEAKERLARMLASDHCFSADKLWKQLSEEQQDMLVDVFKHIIGDSELLDSYEEWLQDYYENDAYDYYLDAKNRRYDYD